MDLIKVKQGTARKMDNTDNPNFSQWIARVNKLLTHFYGLTIDDLPDCLYSDWYESRLKPIFAAKKAIKNAEEY